MSHNLPLPLIGTCILGLHLVSPLPAGSVESGCLQEIARTPSGTSTVVEAWGKHVVFGSGLHLVVADVNDQGMVEIARTRLPGIVRDIERVGDLALVACERRGLAVIDLSVLSAPVQIGFGASDDALAVAVDHDTVVIAAGDAGVVAFDIATPNQPFQVWRLPDASFARDIVTDRGMAYVIDSRGIAVIDPYGSGGPLIVGRIVEDRHPSALAVSDHHLYVTGFDRGLDVIDISHPDAPQIVGQSSQSASSGWRVDVDQGIAAVSNGHLYLLDVSDPTAPTFLSSLAASDVLDASIREQKVFLADGGAGIALADIQDPSLPILIDRLTSGVGPTSVERSGTLAVVAGARAMELVDVSRPETPVVRGTFETTGELTDLDVDQSLVYLADSAEGVVVVSIENPDNPSRIGGLSQVTLPLAIAAADGLCLVTEYKTLVVLDTSDPTRIVRAGELPLDAICWDIELDGTTAFLSCRGDGFVAVDLSVPSAPVRAGGFSVAQAGGGSAASSTVVDGLAYVAFRQAGLQVLDVSDPTHITRVGGSTEVELNALDVAVDGALASVSDWHHGVWVFDVSKPQSMALVDRYIEPGHSWAVASASGLLMSASWSGGLGVFNTRYCEHGEIPPALTWQPTEPAAGQPVSFAPLDLGADSWEWSFGDGKTMTGMLPTQRFRWLGSTTVSLTVTHGSQTDTYVGTFDVIPPKPRSGGTRHGG